MINIVFESHSTSFDNEAGLASGDNNVALSPLGISQAKELGLRYQDQHFDAIYCSDLERSYHTAELAFGDRFPIYRDKRLRECDYGALTQQPSKFVDPQKISHLEIPFPGGESYGEATSRVIVFLKSLQSNTTLHQIMIIGHRATQYGLEQYLNSKSLPACLTDPWHWQPGWKYKLPHTS